MDVIFFNELCIYFNMDDTTHYLKAMLKVKLVPHCLWILRDILKVPIKGLIKKNVCRLLQGSHFHTLVYHNLGVLSRLSLKYYLHVVIEDAGSLDLLPPCVLLADCEIEFDRCETSYPEQVSKGCIGARG